MADDILRVSVSFTGYPLLNGAPFVPLSGMKIMTSEPPTRPILPSLNLPPRLNLALVKILTAAADRLAQAATECETCVRHHSPDWHEAVQLLDRCTDELRDVVVKWPAYT
jgi:hypothetical protein